MKTVGLGRLLLEYCAKEKQQQQKEFMQKGYQLETHLLEWRNRCTLSSVVRVSVYVKDLFPTLGQKTGQNTLLTQ